MAQASLGPVSACWEADEEVWLLDSGSGSGGKPHCRLPLPYQQAEPSPDASFHPPHLAQRLRMGHGSEFLALAGRVKPTLEGSPSLPQVGSTGLGAGPSFPSPTMSSTLLEVWCLARRVGFFLPTPSSATHRCDSALAREWKHWTDPTHWSRQHSPSLQSILGFWGL